MTSPGSQRSLPSPPRKVSDVRSVSDGEQTDVDVSLVVSTVLYLLICAGALVALVAAVVS